MQKPEIADLSDRSIEHMSGDELLQVIRAARLSGMIGASDLEQVQGMPREALKGLAYKARRYCRTQGY
jgi:hypothetical protein